MTTRTRIVRLLVHVAIAATFLAGGVYLGRLGSSPAEHLQDAYASPGPLLLTADQRTLVGTVGGTCIGAKLEVAETSTTVTVRLHQMWYPNGGIAGVCRLEAFTAQLTAPLGARQLVDGVTGAALPRFDGGGILRPAYLPAGFEHRYDAAAFADESVASSKVGCIQIYTAGDSYDEAIWIRQDVGGVWQPPSGVANLPITVRGHQGHAIPGEIEWTEQGQLFTIASRSYPYATIATPELIRIAESLH